MKLIDEIRRDNLVALAAEYGSIANLAVRLDKAYAQVSQLINGSKDSRTGKPRGMRSATARYIEERCKKPVGWLDVEHPATGAIQAHSLSQEQHLQKSVVTEPDHKAKLKQLLRELGAMPKEVFDGRDALFVQELLADLKRDARASFQPNTDPNDK